MKKFTADTIQIGAYFGPFSKTKRYPDIPDALNDASFRLAKDGGFNFLICYTQRYPETRDDVFRALDCAERAGMKMLLSDSNIEQGTIEAKLMRQGKLPDMRRDYTSSVKDYGGHPAFLGCYIVDEPLPPKFPLLRDIRKVFDSVTPDKLFFVNMLPVYGISAMENEFWIEEAERREEVYGRYISGYLETVKPPLLCYDYYPFQGEFPEFGVDYFVNLAVARREAQRAGIPLWVSPQAAVQGNMRALCGAEMRMQVNTSLAFGATGLIYFCWSMPCNGMCGKEVYSQALTDAGKPMPMYSFAKEVNLWVHKIEKFLLNGKNLGILQAGTSPAPIPAYAFAETRGSLLDFSAKHALAGVFKIGGEFGYLIVNNSIDEEDEIRVSLSQKFLSYSADGEREIGKSAVFRLAPGDAVFLKQI